MKSISRSRSPVEIGFAALPVILCLFAGLVCLSAQPEPPDSPAPEDLDALQQLIVDLEAQSQELLARIDQLKRNADEGKAKFTQLALLEQLLRRVKAKIENLEREKNELEKDTDEHRVRLAKRQKLHEEIKQLKEEIAKARRRIAVLLEKKKDLEGVAILGGYDGPRVVLECVEGAVVVHPDRRRIKEDPSDGDKAWLLLRVDQEGFVVLAVRPDGFKGSFDAFFKIITAHIDGTAARDRKIGLSFFPIGPDEPVSKYLPKGAKK